MDTYYNLCDVAEEKLIKFNKSLFKSDTEISLNDYIIKNSEDYDIDSSLIKELINFVDINDYVIHHNNLQKYGLLNNIKDISSVKKILQQCEFIENVDYIVTEKANGHDKIYKLRPRAFKLCLMRSLKTRKYAEYYLFLETCIKYYNDYQTGLQKARKDAIEKEYELSKTKHEKTVVDLYALIGSIKSDNKKYMSIIEETNSTVNELMDKAECSEFALKKISKKLKVATIDREPQTRNKEKLCEIVVLKNNDPNEKYKYHVIRAQKKYIKCKLKVYTSEHENTKQILHLDNVTSSIILWNKVKEGMTDMIRYTNNGFNIRNKYSEKQC